MSQQQYEDQGAKAEWFAQFENKHPSIKAWPGKPGIETMNTIASAFVKAKRTFGPALKDKVNPAFRSKYADLGACIDAVEQPLLDNGIAFIQETCEDATGVTVETVFLHESGETMRCGKLHVPAAKQDPQGYGSALTYARRYSLMAACGIAPEDDDGNAATKAKDAERAAAEQARREQRANWLADQQAAIDAASTAGELKRIVADAIGIAAQERDDDAIGQINRWAAAKVEKAKPKPAAKRPEVSEMATA